MSRIAFVLFLAGIGIFLYITGTPRFNWRESPFAWLNSSPDLVPSGFPLGTPQPSPDTTSLFPTLATDRQWLTYSVQGWMNSITFKYPPDWFVTQTFPDINGEYGNVVGAATVSSQENVFSDRKLNKNEAVIQVSVQTGGPYYQFDELLDCNQQFTRRCETVEIHGLLYRYVELADSSGEEVFLLATENGGNVYVFRGFLTSDNQRERNSLVETIKTIYGTIRL